MAKWTSFFEEHGYAVVPHVLSSADVDALLGRVALENAATHSRGGKTYANREALSLQAVADVARSEAVVDLARAALGPCFAVRAILFDKVPGANWKVPWHQDLTVAVEEKAEVDGYGPWSVKEGRPHVQPPASVLERMVSVRLHLDPCGLENGPLRVVAGTHRSGKLGSAEVDAISSSERAFAVTCDKGDAVLMRPLLLHASSPAESPSHRRVLHIDYSSCELASPLAWAWRV